MIKWKSERHTTIKHNEIRPFVATWMKQETIKLRKVSQKGKDKYYMLSLGMTCGI